jgi:site-specific DNA-methyltransferase (adenine-specific)
MLEIEEMDVSRLSPWEQNPRVNEHAVKAVARSVESFGFNVPILCDQNLMIIAGHTRWNAAKSLGLATVPVIRLTMSESQRKAFAVADNKTAEIADWDFPKLREVLEELRTEDVSLADLGFSDEELRRFLGAEEQDEGNVPETPEVPTAKAGDLWELGSHRLLCGDSRDEACVARLVQDAQVDHVFGGPPYFNQREYAQWRTYDEYLVDMRQVIANCRRLLRDGGVIVWNVANDCSEHKDLACHHSRLLEEMGLKYLDTVAWVKTKANYAIPRNFHIKTNRKYFPAFQWEPLLVFQKPGEMPTMTREASEYMQEFHTNVWEIAAITRQAERHGHPAVCPVEIPYRSLLAYSGMNATIFEPFGGSGTTLIAAEKAKRRALLMERQPKYCDVILARWETLTGQKARLFGNNSEE